MCAADFAGIVLHTLKSMEKCKKFCILGTSLCSWRGIACAKFERRRRERNGEKHFEIRLRRSLSQYNFSRLTPLVVFSFVYNTASYAGYRRVFSLRVRFFGKIQIRILVSKNGFCVSLPKSENGLIRD